MVDFGKQYDAFIKAKWRECEKQGITKAIGKKRKLEIHHIVPKSLLVMKQFRRVVANNKQHNTVMMSTDDHIFAHLLLNLAFEQRGNNDWTNKLSFTRKIPKTLFLKLLKGKFLTQVKFEGRFCNRQNQGKSFKMSALDAMHHMAFVLGYDPLDNNGCYIALNHLFNCATLRKKSLWIALELLLLSRACTFNLKV